MIFHAHKFQAAHLVIKPYDIVVIYAIEQGKYAII